MSIELRAMRKIAGLSIAGLCFAGLCAALAGCSESSTTAGVISETESGQTASLYLATDHVAARMILTQVIDGRTAVVDSAVTDSNYIAEFKKVPFSSSFSIVAYSYNEDNLVSEMGFASSEMMKENKILNDSGFVKDSISMGFNKPANLKVSASIANFALGDSLCITGTLACGVYDETAQDSGFILLENVPASSMGGAQNSNGFAEYKQIEVIGESGIRTDSVNWHITSETEVVSKGTVAKINGTFNYTMPKASSLDSLSDKTLDSLIVPVVWGCKEACENEGLYLDNQWNKLPSYSSNTSSVSGTTHVTLPPMDSSAQIYLASGEVDPTVETNESRVRYAASTLDSGAIIENALFADSSFALSFWFQADTNTVQDSSADSTVESADSTIILSRIEDNIGFEIRQCGTKATDVCVKIYNGVDTAATDTMEYGKKKLLDGERHHYSIVIHKKHLSIVVDGSVLRSTDLKLSESFYKLEEIKIGATVENIVLYSFGDFIRKPDDKDWYRLNAWLQAFYELQKDNI